MNAEQTYNEMISVGFIEKNIEENDNPSYYRLSILDAGLFSLISLLLII